MAGYWPSSLFALLWTETQSRSLKTQKENEANIQLSLVNKGFTIWHSTPSCCFVFYFYLCLFLLQNLFLKLINIFAFFVFILVNAFAFSFSSSSPTEKSQKIIFFSRKILCERKLSCTCLNLDFGEILLL